jgi:deoxyribodipyrimidine photolyase-related protein
MKSIALIFPHQLFEDHPALKVSKNVLLIEDPLFFGDHKYPLKFHKMKLTFHRASMKLYAEKLENKGFAVDYIDYSNFKKDRHFLFKRLKKNKFDQINVCRPDDFILNLRLEKGAKENNIKIEWFGNPSFMNDPGYLTDYFKNKKSYFQHYFYAEQRKKFDILVENGKPVNGKWSFDSENRKSIPKDLKIPKLPSLKSDKKFIEEAKKYVNNNFKSNPGSNDNFYLPISTATSKKWLDDFLKTKFDNYGSYQDAIVKSESFLFHSLLSPLINSGLLMPDQVIDKAFKYADSNDVPFNSLEGFIRQIIGWREFIRAVYLIDGVKQRNSNFWNNDRKIPKSFYDGTTGIEPIDETIKKLLKTGYNHHIERLMLLGNFMLLCEIHPTDVYKWFMEMYVDSYDWVMVPNVYGMSQFADGGLMSTKPYISSSNYVKKMSDYKSGDWTKIWDALFWNFIHKHQKYFSSNNRTVFISRNLEKMSKQKLEDHIKTADEFLSSLK